MKLEKIEMPTFTVTGLDRSINLWELGQLRLNIVKGLIDNEGIIIVNNLTDEFTTVNKDGRFNKEIFKDYYVSCLIEIMTVDVTKKWEKEEQD